MEVVYDNLSAYLTSVKDEVLNHYVNQLKSRGYEIADSVKINIRIDENNHQLVLTLKDYWKWIENGRKAGKQPPINDILRWINKKNIQPRERGLSKRSMAFLIARKIGLQGIKGKGLLKNTEDTYRESFIEECTKAITKDIYNALKSK